MSVAETECRKNWAASARRDGVDVEGEKESCVDVGGDEEGE